MENDFLKQTGPQLLRLKGLDWYFGSWDMQLCVDHNNNNKQQTNTPNTQRMSRGNKMGSERLIRISRDEENECYKP